MVTYHRPAFALMHIELSGKDDAALTILLFRMLEKELAFDQRRWPRMTGLPRMQLFVDAGRVSRHGLMFESWIRFLVQYRQRFHRIHILADNPVSRLAAEIICHLSNAESILCIYDDTDSFDRRMDSLLANRMTTQRYRRDTVQRIQAHLQTLQRTLQRP